MSIRTGQTDIRLKLIVEQTDIRLIGVQTKRPNDREACNAERKEPLAFALLSNLQ